MYCDELSKRVALGFVVRAGGWAVAEAGLFAVCAHTRGLRDPFEFHLQDTQIK